MAIIKFYESTDYDAVAAICWEMFSEIQSDKCGCNEGNSKDMFRCSALLNNSRWEKDNRPDRYIKTIKNVYYLLLSLSK